MQSNAIQQDGVSGLSVGFWVGGSIQKVGGYYHFISPISHSELNTNIRSNRRSICEMHRWNAPVKCTGEMHWLPAYFDNPESGKEVPRNISKGGRLIQ